MKLGLPLLCCGLTILAGACKVGPDYTAPEAKLAAEWTHSPAPPNRPPNSSDTYWWHYLDDSVLNELIRIAHQNNLSLQAAGVRVLEARARLNQSIGNLFPQQQGISAGVGYSRLNDGLANRIPGINPDYVADRALFMASWEIDFWGKYRRGIEADRASYFGSFAAYEDALVTLTADVATLYVNFRTTEERLRVARRNVALQAESLRIAAAQFKAGERSERDVQQASAQLAQTEAQIPLLVEALNKTQNGLAVLLSEPMPEVRKRLTPPGGIPVAPTAIALGIPYDLLRQRPDVRAAGYAAASKSAAIGVARANMYPSFSLSGEFGATGNNQGQSSLADMFTWEGRALNAAAGFFFPIFNYGRLLNQVRVQDAQFQEAVLNYQNTVLVAQQEVENGLATLAGEQQSLTSLTNAVIAARRSAHLALIQYQSGQVDFTTVLSAEQAQLATEDSLATTQGSVVLGLISVYRALGGGWAMHGGDDFVSAAVKAEMSRRTDWGKMLEPAHHLPRQIIASEHPGLGSTAN